MQLQIGCMHVVGTCNDISASNALSACPLSNRGAPRTGFNCETCETGDTFAIFVMAIRHLAFLAVMFPFLVKKKLNSQSNAIRIHTFVMAMTVITFDYSTYLSPEKMYLDVFAKEAPILSAYLRTIK